MSKCTKHYILVLSLMILIFKSMSFLQLIIVLKINDNLKKVPIFRFTRSKRFCYFIGCTHNTYTY